MAERSVEASPSSAGRLDRKDSNFSALSWLKTAEFLTSHHLPEKQSLPAYSALAAIGEERAHNIRGIMDMDSIDADVERSGIEGVHSQMSEEQRDAHHASLRRLLRAWCVLRPDVGYAQSMNFVASFSLALFGDDESSAFTLFCGLMATLDSQFHAQWPPLIGFHVEVCTHVCSSYHMPAATERIPHLSLMNVRHTSGVHLSTFPAACQLSPPL